MFLLFFWVKISEIFWASNQLILPLLFYQFAFFEITGQIAISIISTHFIALFFISQSYFFTFWEINHINHFNLFFCCFFTSSSFKFLSNLSFIQPIHFWTISNLNHFNQFLRSFLIILSSF